MNHTILFSFSGISLRNLSFFILLITISWEASAQLTPDFSADQTAICTGSSVTFTNLSTGTSGTTTYEWDFGTGASPASQTGPGPHTVTYSGSGSATVSLTLTDGDVVTETKTDYINISVYPSAPLATVTQPDCNTSTATIDITSPVGANYEYSTDGSIWQTSTSFSGLSANTTYTVRVRDISGNATCISSSEFVIDPQPVTPAAPSLGTLTQPDCDTPTGSVILNGLPSSGTWTINEDPGGASLSGTGTSTSFTGLAEGNHSFTVTNEDNCTSDPSSQLTIDPQPSTPGDPVIDGTIQPNCSESTGSVSLTDLPSSGTWTLTINPDGTSSNGSGTTTNVSGLASGTYTFTVTNAENCTSGASPEATINPQPSTPPSPTQSIDCTLGAGQAVVTIESPLGSEYEYSLDGGTYQTSTSFSNVAEGFHTITVRNTAGCTTAGPSFEVACECVDGPTLSLSSTSGSTCGTNSITVNDNVFGGSASSVSLSHNGAGSVSPVNISTSPFSFTYTPDPGDAGTTVSITLTTDNPSGSPCLPATATYNLTVSPLPSAPTVGTITQPDCDLATGSVVLEGLPSGSWTLTENPGGETLNGSGTSTSISGLNEGTYNYTVTNSNGCLSAVSSDVVINAQPSSPAVPLESVDCNLGAGQAVVSVTEPLGGQYQYSLDGGTFQSEASFSNVANGFHSITVRNTEDCETTGSSFEVDCGCADPPTITLTSNSGSVCGTSDVIVSGNTFGGSATSVSITEDGAGTINPVSVSASPFSFTYTPDPADVGNTVTISCITNNPDGAPCTEATATYTLTVNPVPSAPVIDAISQPDCNSGTGSVDLTGLPSGNWTLTRSPDNVTTTGSGSATTISGLNPGIYSYTVSNETACLSISSADIIVEEQPSTPAIPTHSVDCALGAGQAIINVESPLGAEYEYSLDGVNFQTSTAFSNIANGSYTLTVRNTDGCTNTGNSFLVDCGCADEPIVSFAAASGNACSSSAYTLSGNSFGGSATSVTLTEDGAGSLSVSSFSSSPFSFTYNPDPADEGNTVTITAETDNPSGPPCSPAIATFTLTINSSPSAPVPVNTTQPDCNLATGSVELTGLPSAGSWIVTRDPGGNTTNGSGESTLISNLSSGTYTFTVTNSQGCSSAPSSEVVINTQPATPESPTQSVNCDLGAGEAVINIESPLGAEYEYSLNGGTYQTATSFSGVDNGSYAITVSNSDGCTTTGSSFDVNCGCANPPTISLNSTSGTICETNSIIVSGNSFGGSATEVTLSEDGAGSLTEYTVSSSPFSFSYTPAAADAGNTVTITLTTNNPLSSPCEASTATYLLTVDQKPSPPTPGNIIHPDCDFSTGSVELSGLPLTGSWTITREPGSVSQSGSGSPENITGIPPGSYTFTVTDEAGCISDPSTGVTINSQPPSPDSPVESVDCSLGVGEAVITVTSPLGAEYQYSLNGGIYQSSTSFSGVDNGSHTLSVRNSSGCITEGSSFDINCGCVDEPTLDLSSSSGSTCGITPVTISGNTFGGNASEVLMSHNGNGTLSPTSSTNSVFSFGYTPVSSDAGNIVTITVTTDNPKGPPCSPATATYNLMVYNPPSVPQIGTITHPDCGESTGSVVLNGLPSTGSWTITRTPGGNTTTGSGTSTTISGIAPGSYSFTVTNENGCVSGVSSSAVIDPAPPVPEEPVHDVDCSLGFDQAVVNVLSPTGNGLVYSLDGSAYQASTSFTNVANGSHRLTVINSDGCATNGPYFTIDCGCVDGPTLSLSSTSGSVCGTSEISVDNNTFGGNASSVSITSDGEGTINSSSITSSPFSFSYTPASADLGKIITITLTTDNPAGAPCEEAVETYSLTVNSPPAIPSVTSLTQPGCNTSTASVSLGSLPAGNWTLVRNPGNITSTGSGSTTIISGLTEGNYSFEVINSESCRSETSEDVIIDPQPPKPSAPTQTIDCSAGFGNAVITVTGPAGSGYEYSLDGGSFQASTTFENVANGSHTLTVRNSDGCTTTGSNFEISCDCVNGPSITLGSPNGSVCGTSSIEVINNSFGGSATEVFLSTDGAGSLSSNLISSSPFSFTYTPAPEDEGKDITITLTTDNPSGSPCVEASANYILTVNSIPVPPSVSSVLQPDCSVPSGSLNLGNLPADSWTVIRDPGGISTNGSGPNTVISGLSSGTYSFRVINSVGCTSGSSQNVVINEQPPTPGIPLIGTITHPDCNNPEGSIFVEGLPSSGEWSLNVTPGDFSVNGSGTGTMVSDLSPGDYTFSVTNSSGCTSGQSSIATINAQPDLPSAPTISSITQPDCNVATGSVSLGGLPSGGSWTVTGEPGSISVSGSGTTVTISDLTPEIYNFRVTNSAGCISGLSANVIIESQPETPAAPGIGTIIQPSCDVSTGSVELNDLPSGGSWTINPGNISGSGTLRTISGLSPGTYSFTVTNAEGCVSAVSDEVTIETQPVTPTVPSIGTITQPGCDISTGRVFLSGLPSTGNWVITRSPGGVTTTGNGSSTTITGIPSGTYTYSVRNADGCSSGATGNVLIEEQPESPPLPEHSIDCSAGAGAAVITVSSPAGADYQYSLDGSTFQDGEVFSGIENGSYTITVMNAAGCLTTGPGFSVSCGCPDPPAVSLSSTSGFTCGLEAVTVSNNTFGGSATSVSIRSDGAGTIIPELATGSPFEFTYEPASADAGNIVRITVTTDNPDGSPCVAATEVYSLRVYPAPSPPIIGEIIQPTCTSLTGRVELTGLPAEGAWTVSGMPGNIEREGSGEITYISNLSVASYNFSVSDENGCSSELSGNAEILSPPDNPDPPVLESISPPTCTRSTGIISLGGLPSGSWTLTRVQGGVTRTGTGSTLSIENVVSGSYNYRVRNEEGCSSEMSESMVVPPQPEIPSAPLVDQITQPTCEEPLGRVLLSGLPTEGAWTLVRFPGSISITGSGEEMEITGLLPGIYNYLVSSEAGCTSSASENIRINVSPDVPETPAVGQVIQPGCTNPVGSITLTGLPTGNWTLTRYPDEITTTGAGTITTISDLEPGNYSFRVSNSSGCTSQESQTISIISNPDAPELIITDPQPVCEPETVDLRDSLITAGSTAGLSFTYYQDEELSMEVERPDSATDGIYYIRAQSREGCIAIGQVEVSVVSPPIAEAGPDQVLEYEFETYLQANLFSLNDTGTWSAASGTAYFDDVNDPETRVYDLQLGSTLLEWTVRNGICEPVSDSVMIEVQDLVVPTLVTPNMDGKNDYLIFEGLDNLGRTELTIFDRYGAVVFESDNYQNDWNGVNQDGNPLPDDTYFYVFTSENGRAKSSFVVIRR